MGGFRRKFQRSAMAACWAVLLSSVTAEAAVSDWQTAEYYGAGTLDIIDAAQAYELGYTGRGVTIGICDTPINMEHSELSGKAAWPSNISQEEIAETDWAALSHGTHVAGIAAAKRDGKTMHGVAFDSMVKPLTYSVSGTMSESMYDVALQNPEIKVINNSWGFKTFVDTSGVLFSMVRDAKNAGLQSSFYAQRKAAQYGTLAVRTPGNQGHAEAQISAIMPAMFPEMKNYVINVTNLYNDRVQRSGSSFSAPSILHMSSDHAKYAEDYTLTAPGTEILSAYANYAEEIGTEYVRYSGSSMAAPVVTGVGALVQQAFPYMDGKQIGDVLLSTANSNVTLTEPVQVSVVQDTDSAGKRRQSLAFFCTDDRSSLSMDEMWEVLERRVLSGDKEAAFLLNGLNQGARYRVYYKVPLEEFIGQGIVNAGKAVQGPGALNARRLTSEDIYRMNGEKQALYPIDTKGYTSVWSNDIGEIRAGLLADSSTEDDLKARYEYYMENWGTAFRRGEDRDKRTGPYHAPGSGQTNRSMYDAKGRETGCYPTMEYIYTFNQEVLDSGLAGLHVGLLKKGEGTLILTGNNSYLGDSVAAGGTLEINGSVAGNAQSLAEGTIAGSGTINGTLYNRSYAVAGNSYGEGTLTAKGLESTGTLYVQATENGASSFKVNGTADVTGSRFMARPATVNGILLPRSNYGVVLTAGNIVGALSEESTSFHPLSAMLSGIAVQSGNTISYSVDTSEHLNMTATVNEEKIFGAMKRMYDVQDTAQQRRLAEVFFMQEASARAALKGIAGDDTMTGAGAPQTVNLAADVIGPRLSQAFTMQTAQIPLTANHWMETAAGGNALMIPISFAPNEGGWMKFSKHWGHYGAADAGVHGSSMSFGYDRRMGEHGRAGIFASYGANYAGGSGTSLNNYDWRLGIYGGWQKGPQDAYVYFDYGWERNSMKRGLGILPLTASSSFNGRILELGGEYRYDLQPKRTWHVSPYVNLKASRYLQDGYRENGAGVFDRRVASWSNNYVTGGLGMEIRRALTQNGFFSARLGWRHVFTGANPTYRYTLANDPRQESIDGRTRYDKNFITCRLYAEQPLDSKWSLCADAGLEKGSHDREITASVAFRCVW